MATSALIMTRSHSQGEWIGSQLRSATYLSDRKKQTAGPDISTLLGCDMFKLDNKVEHIAQHLKLPDVPTDFPPPPPGLPALFIVNLMVPLYEPQFFTTLRDGDGLSCVWYWAIDYRKVQPEAMACLKRFLEQVVPPFSHDLQFYSCQHRRNEGEVRFCSI